jgi:hypothetical protein
MFGIFNTKNEASGEKGISRILGALGAFGLDFSTFYPEIIKTIITEGKKMQDESGKRLSLFVTLSDDNTQIIAGLYHITENGFELYKSIDLSTFESLINGINTTSTANNAQLEPGTDTAGTDTSTTDTTGTTTDTATNG